MAGLLFTDSRRYLRQAQLPHFITDSITWSIQAFSPCGQVQEGPSHTYDMYLIPFDLIES